jgi:hypothetical protein
VTVLALPGLLGAERVIPRTDCSDEFGRDCGTLLKLTAEASNWWDHGAQDWSSPNFMELARFGLDIDIFCDFLFSVLLLNAIFGARFLRARPVPAAGGTSWASSASAWRPTS